ncbi:MAG: hypothetical protein KBC43_03185 [Bacteroidales bacterium]|nr:hypothetical protein [Bacteroidales bacterium]
MLYKFEQLDVKLTELGFPQVEVRNPYVAIQTDFERAFREGNISFEPGGIFIEHEGHKYKGYMFIKEYHITRFRSFPKFHLVKCETIDEFIRNGRFNIRYQFSNTATNNVVDIDSGTDYPDQVLRLCRYCSRIINENIPSTEHFFNQLHEDEEEEEEIMEVDIYGYVRNWNQISREYRHRKDYTCETCGIQIKSNIDRRYLHVHHKNGDKTNNHLTNLECNCILCHAYKDRAHEDNFSIRRLRFEMRTFVNKFRSELQRLHNPFLRRFDDERN